MTQRGIDPSTLSEAIRPNDDFFRYVNGPWLETHKIPDDRAADGAFYALHDEAEKQVRAIIEESPRDELTGALYASFMDTDKADALGAQPIEPDLAAVDAVNSHEELAATIGDLQLAGVGGIVGY
ncbi:MAG: peptidase M13, partial [Actinobacteria bacterium HGW-Actinobacteria-8]